VWVDPVVLVLVLFQDGFHLQSMVAVVDERNREDDRLSSRYDLTGAQALVSSD